MTGMGSEGATVLVVDDEPGICRALSEYLVAEGHHALTASSAEEALKALDVLKPQVAFVDLRLPGMNGLSLLKEMRRRRHDLQIVLITAYGGPDAAIQATQAGAYAYLPKPFDIEEVGRIVRRSLARSAAAVSATEAPDGAPWELVLSGTSPGASRLREQLRACARRTAPVLLAGEFGSGREAAAQALHASLEFASVPFVPVRCSVLVPGEIDGTLDQIAGNSPALWFLMDLDDLEPESVASVLQRVSSKSETGWPRVIASARRSPRPVPPRPQTPLVENVRRRGWSVVEVPPLRARRRDLRVLVSALLARINRELDRQVRGLDAAAFGILERHRWPGNLRELENAIRVAALATRDDVVRAEALPRFLSSMGKQAATDGGRSAIPSARDSHQRRPGGNSERGVP